MKLSKNYYKMEQVISYIEDHYTERPTLSELSNLVNMSESHFSREFKKWVGVSPKTFLQVFTLDKAKFEMTNGLNHLEVSDRLGLSSASRLYDLFVSIDAMTPGEYRLKGKGLDIEVGQLESPLGNITIGLTERGICYLGFDDCSGVTLGEIQKKWPKANIKKISDTKKEELQNEITLRIQGNSDIRLSLLLSGTEFQVKVWEALLKIPMGEVRTYKKIAEAINKSKAYRAVGTAIGANPVGVLIPCHRVIQASGAVGGYHWGPLRKKTLLSIEKASQVIES